MKRLIYREFKNEQSVNKRLGCFSDRRGFVIIILTAKCAVSGFLIIELDHLKYILNTELTLLYMINSQIMSATCANLFLSIFISRRIIYYVHVIVKYVAYSRNREQGCLQMDYFSRFASRF